MDEKAFEEQLKLQDEKAMFYVKSHSEWSGAVVKMQPGHNAVVANGKVIE